MLEPRTARRLIVAVGAGYLLAELTLLSIHRAVSWDEAVYLSQVTPGMRAMGFVASRARGVTLLALPIVQLGGSLVVVRFVLAVAAAAALVGAFAAWPPTIGTAAVWAAIAFGSTWLALLYGSEVMPNLWSALLAVAAVGVAMRTLVGERSWRWTLGAAALLALLGLFRPPDAVPVLLAILVAAAGTGRFGRRGTAVLLVGLVAGWVPWLVEMSVRFGGPVEAVRQARIAARVGTTSIGERLIQHLALTNGPILGPLDDPHVAIGGIVWWAALVTLAGVALALRRGSPMFRPLLAATTAGLGLAAEYLLLVEGVAPRFLLPTYALLSIPAAVALVDLARRLRTPAARAALVVAVAGPWFVWQMGTAHRIEPQTNEPRVSLQQVAAVLVDESGGASCTFASTDGFPQIEYTSGCRGRFLARHDPSPATISKLEDALAAGLRAFVVTQEPTTLPTSATTAELLRTLPAPRSRTWYVYALVPVT